MTRKRVAVLAVTTLVLAAVMTTATWALSRTHGPRPGTMMSGRANTATVRGTGFMSGTCRCAVAADSNATSPPTPAVIASAPQPRVGATASH